MSTALHLAPLVSAGFLPPVDLYEARDSRGKRRPSSGSSDESDAREGGRQTEPGSGAVGRDIGVGIWSTAWEPFLRSLSENEEGDDEDDDEDDEVDANAAKTALRRHKRRRASHVNLLRDLEACGSYVKDVGYRTPDGTWLVRSVLNDRPFGIRDVLGSGSGSGGDDIPNDQDDDDTDPNTISNSNSNKIPNSNSTSKDEPRPRNLADNRLDPALLFVREKDLLSCLRNAVRAEQSLGTIRYHAGTEVRELDLDLDLADDPLDRHAGRLILLPSDAAATVSPPYHLVVAADGLHSSLRSRYAGHHSHNASTTGMDSTRDHREDDGAMASSVEYRWEHTQGQREATQVDDRKYVVFRGNAPKLDELHGGDDGSQSFQTWGEERSMRFAAVPFRHACDADSDAERERGPSFRWKRKDDEEVWFATLSDPLLYDGGIDAMTAERRKRFLLDAFGSWHEPVKTLVASTPAEKIMYETAVAHRYCASPVVDVARILEFERWRKRQERRDGDGDAGAEDNNDDGEEPTIRGLGPILVFVGDSCMTVDPVLAQGFTIAMEAGASLASSVETVVASSAAVMPSSSSEMANPHGDAHNSPPHPLTHTAHTHTPSIQQQTHKLKRELLRRHALRERRLIQLLRSTELVQIMAQPHGVMGGFLARWVVRPLMRYCPEVVKRGVFHWVIRYSLGLTGGHDGGGGAGAGGR